LIKATYEAAADIRDQIEMNSFHFDQVTYNLVYHKSTQEIRIHFPATFIVVQDHLLNQFTFRDFISKRRSGFE
jgi:hypothetical protein